jgi:hypothetical protein
MKVRIFSFIKLTLLLWFGQDILVNDRYRVDQKIAEGSFSLVYSGIYLCFSPFGKLLTCIGTDLLSGEEIAIKLEYIHDGHDMLQYEADTYKTLLGGRGIPCVRWFGQDVTTTRLSSTFWAHHLRISLITAAESSLLRQSSC